MNRREFLKLGGRFALASGAAGLLAACGSGGGAVVSPTPTGSSPTPSPPSPSPSPSPTPVPPTDADWAALGAGLDGRLVLPGDPSYGTDRRLFNPRFDAIKPAGIVYAGSPSDVQRSVAFVRDHGLPIAARSGGHSYAGYSTGTGLVCDVTSLSSVKVDTKAKTAVVGSGTRLIDLYAGLAPHGVAVPGGSCPTVGIAGLCLGGGVGVVGRRFGLTCDNLQSVEMVTPSGELLTCDEGQNADLYWACRGGGGGNFGVVTSFTFGTHPLTELVLFFLHWPWAAASDVISGWQGWAPGAPDELWSNCHLLANIDKSPGAEPAVSVGGAYVGTESSVTALISDLQDAVGSPPSSTFVKTYGYLDAMLLEAGCSGDTVAECHLPGQTPGGLLSREASTARSDFVTQPLPAAALQVVVDAVEARQADPASTTIAGIAFDALGGAINRVAPADTAFVHRSALFLAQYNATWPEGSSKATIDANVRLLDAFYAAMRPYASGEAYQNYVDGGLADWQQAYYGSNLARLMEVKKVYDPDNAFSFEQSIQPG